MVGRSLSVPDTMTFPSMNISMSYYQFTLSPSPGTRCATCSPWGPHYQECQHIHKHDLLSVAMVSFTTFGCSVVSFLLKTQWLLTYLISNALSSVGGAATCFRMILQVKKSLNSSICLIQNTQFIQYGCFNIKFFGNYVSNDSTSLYYCFNIDRKILFH